MTSKIDFKKLKPRDNKNVLAEEKNSRPSKANLTDQIMVMFTPEEKQKIIDLANQKGFHKMSPFLRYVLTKHGYI